MKKWAKVVLGCSGVCAALIVGFLAFMWFVVGPAFGIESWKNRKPRFEKAARQGMVVVEAIERFHSDNDRPPSSLADLVPNYLPSMPSTGLSEYPDYEYYFFTNSQSSLVWYDLGTRNGKPMSGLWVYIDGEPEHAILALTLDQSNRVTNARVDRMPEEHAQIEFDRARWADGTSRIEMARSIPHHLQLQGSTLNEVREVLGEPSGSRVLRNSPWELRIECPNGLLNWDVFFYWPTQDYPKYIYGGGTERIGQWCYVHE
jgi:hypothetical protein